MKHCPHCKHKLGFCDFLEHYGSDTLVKHSASGHQREHVCLSCHHKTWIHYDARLFKALIGQYSVVVFVMLFAVVNFGVKPALQLNSNQSILMLILSLSFAMPLGIAYAKYQSAVIKEEKEPA